MELLKLVALDRDDLEIMSVHLQDAIVKVGDVLWRPNEDRLVIGLNRFDWEAAHGNDPQYRRRRTALRFDRVTAVKCRNINCQDKDAVYNLLAVEFIETSPPSGIITLLFSGGAALRVDIECLESELVDLGPVWPTKKCPGHFVHPAGVDGELSSGH